MIGPDRLREVFLREYEQTRNLDAGLHAVRVAILAAEEDRLHREAREQLRSISAAVADNDVPEAIELVCRVCGVRRNVLRKNHRFYRGSNELSRIRWFAVALLVRLGFSVKRSAAYLDIHHTSALYGLKQVKKNPVLAGKVEEIWRIWIERADKEAA